MAMTWSFDVATYAGPFISPHKAFGSVLRRMSSKVDGIWIVFGVNYSYLYNPSFDSKKQMVSISLVEESMSFFFGSI
uniref:Uncharacterized protein n=1 Tax=Utricularia reniformis TaxID=192314 RepID=A0A1Y0B3Z4_9LAMI|nr:hypothetical protein AEK19_MT2016 [Utricularia reniformis]ART32176.1 hypothetical protein AEK19_MT2016 [Utricularia reniformis]